MPVTEAMTAFDPKPKYTTDCYQGVKSNDVIKTKATLPSSPNNHSAIGYLLSTARPHASTPYNSNTSFAKSIPTVVMCIRVSPFSLEGARKILRILLPKSHRLRSW